MAKKSKAKKKDSKKEVVVEEEVKEEVTSKKSKKEKKISKDEFLNMSKEEKLKVRNALVKGDYQSLGLPKGSTNIRVYRDKLGDFIMEYEA